MIATRPLLLALVVLALCAPGCQAPVAQAVPTCVDGLKNGGETDLDCGGACGLCAEGARCGAATDCGSHVCQRGLCRAPTCSDGVANGDEADVDCGGACATCADGLRCVAAGGCRSKVCVHGRCLPLFCADGQESGSETDVDCGGACAQCADGKGCGVAADCASGTCANGSCAAPVCTDQVKNGQETDLDCGGTCSACGNGKACAVAADCQSAVCLGQRCVPATCIDHLKNGSESDVDCGGACTPCALGRACAGAADCQGMANAAPGCSANACVLGTCASGFADCDGKAADGCEASLGSTATCGTCGAACEYSNGTPACGVGGCSLASCESGWGNCDQITATGCERSLRTVADCGACGAPCTIAHGSGTCVTGVCAADACDPGWADCDGNPANGCETDRLTDDNNCGACGSLCASSATATMGCVGGGCAVSTCAAGFGNCDGSPANGCEHALSADLQNCGACGAVCAAVANGDVGCSGGSCGIASCKAGFANCDTLTANGCEANTTTSLLHCGGCNKPCTNPHGTSSCASGACAVVSCTAGFSDCDGNAANGCETDLTAVATCGSCGNNCGSAAGIGCSGSACVYPSCKAVPSGSPSRTYTLGSVGSPWTGYCDMSDNGGGWTLVLKADGNQGTFSYGQPIWSDSTLLNASSTDLSQTEAKLAGFRTVPFTAVRLAMVDSGTTRAIVVNGAGTSLQAVTTGGGLATTAGPASWKSLLASPSLQANCNQEGFNQTAGMMAVRVGIISNQEPDCNTPDSFIGIGANNGSVTTGNLASWNGAGMDRATKTFAYVFVR